MPEHMLPTVRVLSKNPPPVAGKFRVAQMSRGTRVPAEGPGPRDTSGPADGAGPPVAGPGPPVAGPSAGGGKLLHLGGGRRFVRLLRITDMLSGRGNQRMIGNLKNSDPKKLHVHKYLRAACI